MARLVGTGKDPNGQYGEGVLFDVPRDEPHYAELIDNGWAVQVRPEDDPARDTVGIAQAVVRGDALLHPAEQDIKEHIGDRAHAIVQKQDPNAEALRADEGLVPARAHFNPDERPYGEDEANARTSNWEEGTSVGDIATHTTLGKAAGEPAGSPRYPADSAEEQRRRAAAAGTPLNADGDHAESEYGAATPPATEGGAGDLTADSHLDDLQAEYQRRVDAGDLEAIESGSGSGADGAILKADYAKALGLDGGA